MIDWFTSDTHYGHGPVIDFSGRPFGTLVEMDYELECRYRDRVGSSDVVLFVGDVSFHTNDWTRDLLSRLPGRKWLCRGNHDPDSIGACLRLGFELVTDQLAIQLAGYKVVCNHFPPWHSTDHEDDRYPLRRPPHPGKGEYVLHGHSHESTPIVGRRIVACVEAHGYAPVSTSELEALIRKQKAINP